MREMIKQWKHVFKIDPDREISDDDLDKLCTSGTHAMIIGGSTGVTFDNTVELLSRVRRYTVPCVLEVSTSEAIVPGFDLYFVPVVMNTNNAQWITGYHHEAVKEFGAKLPWDQVLAEGYVILNPHSMAAKITGAKTLLDERDMIAYARMAEKMFQFPIFYMEFSGMFGNMNLVERAKGILKEARLFYGGGIDSLEKAKQAAKYAHTIVVGNVIYENLERALETVSIIEPNMLK